jgi:hypothetical protein
MVSFTEAVAVELSAFVSFAFLAASFPQPQARIVQRGSVKIFFI